MIIYLGCFVIHYLKNFIACWNIICAEYYFISCFGKDRDLRAFECDRDFDMVANVKPYKEYILIETENNEEVLWNVHRKLLQITNKAIEVYNTAGYFNIKTYPEIKSMDKQTSTSKPIDSFGN